MSGSRATRIAASPRTTRVLNGVYLFVIGLTGLAGYAIQGPAAAVVAALIAAIAATLVRSPAERAGERALQLAMDRIHRLEQPESSAARSHRIRLDDEKRAQQAKLGRTNRF